VDVPRSPDPAAPPREADVIAVFGTPAAGEDPALGELASVALHAARRAAAILVSGAARPAHDVDTKSSGTDMVSEVDRAAEAAVADVLRERRPDDGLLAEEGTARAGSTGVRWVVDPLDGTTNFLFGVPQWCVSIAAEIDGHPVVGIVVDPSRDETWSAVRGRAARRNGIESVVAERRSTLETALVSTGFGYAADRRRWQAAVLATVAPAVRDLRRFGSAALDLCWVGGGRVDAYYEWGLNPWDLSAGRLVAEQAGARVGVLGDRLVVATTPSLWDPLVELLEQAGGTQPQEPGGEPRHW
jgi:myo-inositol-1(or 4)-monophosphatase